jgi:hypothetical protein
VTEWTIAIVRQQPARQVSSRDQEDSCASHREWNGMTRSRKYYKSQKLQTYIRVRAKLEHTYKHTHTEFIINNLNFSHDDNVTPELDSFLLSISFVKCSRSQQNAMTELCAEGVNNANHSQGWKERKFLKWIFQQQSTARCHLESLVNLKRKGQWRWRMSG